MVIGQTNQDVFGPIGGINRLKDFPEGFNHLGIFVPFSLVKVEDDVVIAEVLAGIGPIFIDVNTCHGVGVWDGHPHDSWTLV